MVTVMAHERVTSVEWAVLLLDITVCGGAAFCYIIANMAARWRYNPSTEHDRKAAYASKPCGYSEEVFMGLRVISHILIAVGVWLGWRQGYRAELGLLPTDNGAPTGDQSYYLNLVFLLYVLLSSSFGVSFFSIGLATGWIGIPVFIDLLASGCLVGLTIICWMIWWKAGLVITMGIVTSVYGVVMIVMLWKSTTYLLHKDFTEVVHDSVHSLKNQVNEIANVFKAHVPHSQHMKVTPQNQDAAVAAVVDSTVTGQSPRHVYAQNLVQRGGPSTGYAFLS